MGTFSRKKSKEEYIYVIATIIVVAIIIAVLVVPGKEADTNQSEAGTQSTEQVTINSFAGRVLEETTEHMIVEPINDKPDEVIGDKVEVLYEEEHIDFYYGIGRQVVVYYEGDLAMGSSGMKYVKTEDISVDGYREFELEVDSSRNKEKRVIISSEEMQNITFYGHLRYSNLYYYGLDDVQVKIKGSTIPLKKALEQGSMALNGILTKADEDVSNGVAERISYDDGGTTEYKYPDYTIIAYNTLDGNTDIYIGSPDMDIQIADK